MSAAKGARVPARGTTALEQRGAAQVTTLFFLIRNVYQRHKGARRGRAPGPGGGAQTLPAMARPETVETVQIGGTADRGKQQKTGRMADGPASEDGPAERPFGSWTLATTSDWRAGQRIPSPGRG